MNKLIAPSILSANFANLRSDIEMLNNSLADYIHIDVMDGVFVPNISFGFPIMDVLSKYSKIPLDVHLMIVNPEKYVERFAEYNPWSVGFHLEATENPKKTIDILRKKNCNVCLTINPDIQVERLFPYLDQVDMVLLMSVFAGFGGQKFIENTYRKLEIVRNEIDKRGLKTLIEIDGGVNIENAHKLFSVGADILVSGSSIFNSKHPEQEIYKLKNS